MSCRASDDYNVDEDYEKDVNMYISSNPFSITPIISSINF